MYFSCFQYTEVCLSAYNYRIFSFWLKHCEAFLRKRCVCEGCLMRQHFMHILNAIMLHTIVVKSFQIYVL